MAFLDRVKIENVTIEGVGLVGIYLEALEEIDAIEDSFDTDEHDIDELRDFAETHAPWGWCTIRCVAVAYERDDAEGDDYLGACMYKDAQDFVGSKMRCTAPDGTTTESGYYDDMKAQAIDNLRKALEATTGA